MADLEIDPKIKKGRNKLAATVIIGHAFKHIYLSSFQSILLPEIKLGLGLSDTQLGGLATSRQVTAGVTTMGAGYLGDRFSSKAAIMLGISLSLMGAAYFIAGSATNFWLMFGAMLLVGIGPSLYHPPAIGAISRRFPDKRGFAISLHGMGGNVGEFLGPMIAAGLLSFLVWRDILHISVVPALLGAFIIWRMMSSVPGGDFGGTSSFKSYVAALRSLLAKKALLALVLITALNSMGRSVVIIFLPVYLREDLGFSAGRVAVFISLAYLIGIAAQPVMGFLSDRLGRKTVLIPSIIMLGFLFFLLRYVESGSGLIITILACGAFIYPLHAIFISAAMDVTSESVQSTTVSLIYGAAIIGSFSPVIAGIIADSYGTNNAFIYAGSLVCLSAVILAPLKLPRTAVQMFRKEKSQA